MPQSFLKRATDFFASSGINKSDDLLVVQTKNILKAIGVLMSIAGVIWAALLFYFSLYYQALIPIGYVVLTTVNMYLFHRYKNFTIVRILQIGASILLPFVLQIVLGGIMNSGGVMLWSILGLTGVLAVYKSKKGNYWLVYFFILFTIVVALDDYSKRFTPDIFNDSVSTMLMIVNFSLISLIIFIVGRMRTVSDIKLRSVIEHKNVKISRSNRDLKHITKDLTAVNNELKNFAYIVSHDLKAPLRGVSSLVDFLQKDEEKNLSADGREMLGLIKTRIVHSYDLIDGILSYSKINKNSILKVLVESHQMVNDMIPVLTSKEGVKIKVDAKLPAVSYDKTMLSQIFQNLLSNAVMHNDKKDTLIEVGCDVDPTEYIFSVADNGSGIDEKHQSKIFELFEYLNKKEKNSMTNSTGIGLAIVKKIVELNDGRIWLDSKLGEGTTFYFSVPRKVG